jgi:hypothetical protein
MLAVAAVVLAGCAIVPTRERVRNQPVLAASVYLANNIHAQFDVEHLSASYANWTDIERHRLIPVNSQVTVHQWQGGLAIRQMDDGKLPIIMEYDAGHMMMLKEEYVDLITSEEPLDLQALSELDREGVKEGKAKPGMSKQGVRIALGYPARHETPSLEDREWTYWRNRWMRYKVVFDENGKVTEIVD